MPTLLNYLLGRDEKASLPTQDTSQKKLLPNNFSQCFNLGQQQGESGTERADEVPASENGWYDGSYKKVHCVFHKTDCEVSVVFLDGRGHPEHMWKLLKNFSGLLKDGEFEIDRELNNGGEATSIIRGVYKNLTEQCKDWADRVDELCTFIIDF